MADRTDTDQGQQAPPGEDAAAALARVEAELAGQGSQETSKTATAAAGQDRVTEEPLSGEVTVPYGDNLTRRLKVDDLVQAHQRLSEIQRKEQEHQAQVDKLSGLKALAEHLDTLTPAQQKALQRVLADPALLDQRRPRAAEPDDDDADFLDDVAAGKPARTKAPAEPDDRDELRQKVDTIAAYLAQQERGRRQEDLRTQVGSLLEQFPVFRGDKQKEVHALALDSVMNALAADPRSDLEGLVRDRAQKFSTAFDSARKATVTEAFGSPSAQPVPKVGEAPTADDLMGRKLPSLISRAMQSLGG